MPRSVFANPAPVRKRHPLRATQRAATMQRRSHLAAKASNVCVLAAGLAFLGACLVGFLLGGATMVTVTMAGTLASLCFGGGAFGFAALSDRYWQAAFKPR